MTTLVDNGTYIASPFAPSLERADVVSAITRGLMQFETIFTDYHRGCEESCGECEACLRSRDAIAYILSHPDSRAWEVWRMDDEPTLAGVILLTHVQQGVNAIAHFAFFDSRLRDKTELLENMIQWTFTEHPGWKALKRLSIEIPDYAFALARYAYRELGFGGDYVFRQNGKSIAVEGIKRKAFGWRGVQRDLLLMGRVA